MSDQTKPLLSTGIPRKSWTTAQLADLETKFNYPFTDQGAAHLRSLGLLGPFSASQAARPFNIVEFTRFFSERSRLKLELAQWDRLGQLKEAERVAVSLWYSLAQLPVIEMQFYKAVIHVIDSTIGEEGEGNQEELQHLLDNINASVVRPRAESREPSEEGEVKETREEREQKQWVGLALEERLR